MKVYLRNPCDDGNPLDLVCTSVNDLFVTLSTILHDVNLEQN